MLWSDWTDKNWDLGVVVKSCRSGGATPPSSAAGGEAGSDPLASLSPLLHGDDDADEQSFDVKPDPLATQMAMQELEELYQPFFHKDEAAIQHPISAPSVPEAAPPQAQRHRAPESKIRKKKPKKVVVCQMLVHGLTSDLWSWRKYGQKSIKGSPHPRAYYKCSSSKECPARKKVDRSRSNPNMFKITYISKHNHPIPTHRHALAGTTRKEYNLSTTTQQPPAAAEVVVAPAVLGVLSPSTPITTTSAEEYKLRR